MVEGEERAAVIAKGLSEHRRFLLSKEMPLISPRLSANNRPAFTRSVNALRRDGLLKWTPNGWTATELGLTVREHLTRTPPHPDTTPGVEG